MGHCNYRGIVRKNFQHNAVKHSAKEYVDGMVHTNGAESGGGLKHGYYGTYHNWSVKHMRRYVNQFTFQLNDGDVQLDTLDRMVSLSQALCGKRTVSGFSGLASE